MKWNKSYGVYSARVGIIEMTVAWQSSPDAGYKVSVNGRTLKDISPSVEDGQRRAIAFAKRLLTESLSALD